MQTWTDGWTVSAKPIRSPNYGERPVGSLPTLLVIHAISLPLGQFSNALTPSILTSHIDDLFLNQLVLSAHPDFVQLENVRVSAHFLIRRNGECVQFVGALQRAWHAGVSSWLGRSRCNDFSIGIELEGSDYVPFESAQYCTLAHLTASLLNHFPIEHIVGHQDIAPERKTDPGPYFDWKYYQKYLINKTALVNTNPVISSWIHR